jgi:hypothetical protein
MKRKFILMKISSRLNEDSSSSIDGLSGKAEFKLGVQLMQRYVFSGEIQVLPDDFRDRVCIDPNNVEYCGYQYVKKPFEFSVSEETGRIQIFPFKSIQEVDDLFLIRENAVRDNQVKAFRKNQTKVFTSRSGVNIN